jgi:hypothetical protein
MTAPRSKTTAPEGLIRCTRLRWRRVALDPAANVADGAGAQELEFPPDGIELVRMHPGRYATERLSCNSAASYFLARSLATAGERAAIKRQLVPEHHLPAEMLCERRLDE